MESKAQGLGQGNEPERYTHWHARRITRWLETKLDDGRRRWELEEQNAYVAQEFLVPFPGGSGSHVAIVLVAAGEPIATFDRPTDAFDAAADALADADGAK